MAGIVAFGAYIPHLRLQRAAIVTANHWFNPALAHLVEGERAMASWDEDAVTMSVEAARDCLGDRDRSDISALTLASTTLPFVERQNAGLVKEALTLPDELIALDIGGSQKAGVSALIQAMQAVKAGSGPVLCIASERKKAKPGSEAELNNADAAGAMLIAAGSPLARFLGWSTISADFVDHFRTQGRSFDYSWESRWLRDEGYGKIAPQAIAGALSQAGLCAAEIDAFVFPSAIRGVPEMIAKKAGIRADAVRDTMWSVIGDAGTAHPLIVLAHALETAKPGQKLLVAGFGSGCDVIVLEVTEAIADRPLTPGVSGWLARRRSECNYTKYLAFNGLLELERGMRAEFDQKQPLTALWRHRRTVLGLIGGRCTKTGTVQFPRSEIGVGETGLMDTQEDYPLAERTARIITHTADHLTFTPDPPACYGMIEFEGGGRMSVDFCDVDPGGLTVGQPMRMMFRIKSIDERRHFPKYFWKAAPAF